MGPRATPGPRPYWHVDAKWVSGLGLVAVLSVAIVVSAAAAVTSERIAVEAIATGLAVAYSPDGLDDAAGIEEFRARVATAEAGVRPIPSFTITVTAEDLEGSPRQVRIRFMRRLAEPLYRGGPEAFGALASAPEQRSQMTSAAAGFSALSSRTHARLVAAAAILGLAAVLTGVPVVLFSRRFGRMASPGVALLAASLPGTLLLGFVRLALQREPPPFPASGGTGAMASYIAAYVLPPVAAAAHVVYLAASVAGTALLVLAAGASLLARATRRLTPGEPPLPPR